jgi:hypothetical protein
MARFWRATTRPRVKDEDAIFAMHVRKVCRSHTFGGNR